MSVMKVSAIIASFATEQRSKKYPYLLESHCRSAGSKGLA